MDLGICLFCEKRLAQDSLTYCSSTCRAKEAAKECPPSIGGSGNGILQFTLHRQRSASFPRSFHPYANRGNVSLVTPYNLVEAEQSKDSLGYYKHDTRADSDDDDDVYGVLI